MELQQYIKQFQGQGLGVVAITYDSEAILADFSKRQGITYPLLSDPKSQAIRAYGILNTQVPADHYWYGIPYPGTYLVDRNGVVRSKYFEDKYQDRFSAPTILLREFGSRAGTRETVVNTDHLEMKYFSTRDLAHPSLRITLVADIDLKPKMHVYAPGVSGYIPIQLQLNDSPYLTPQPAAYPKSQKLYLAPIQETVAVYQGKFRITQDITLEDSDPMRLILDGNRELKITGRLRYQACDDKICYLPQNIPIEFVLKVEPLDRVRPPEPIRTPGGPAR